MTDWQKLIGIEPESEEGIRIQREICNQIRAELGLSDASIHEWSHDQFKEFVDIWVSRLKHSGIDVFSMLIQACVDLGEASRQRGLDDDAEYFEGLARVTRRTN